MTRTPKRMRKQGGIIAVATLLLMLSIPSSSWGYWGATASPPVTPLNAATVPAPENFDCDALSEGLLGASKYVKFSWTAVSAASSYDVYFSKADGTGRVLFATGVSTPHIEIRDRDIVGGLLSNIISLLVGNQPVLVDAVAVHSSGWTSEPSTPPKTMKRTGLVPLVLGGLACS